MPNERNYYVICEDNCRFEGMTKSQIINEILAEVEEKGMRTVSYNVPFSVKEINAGKEFGLWIGTEEEYNSISNLKENVLYIIAEHNEAKQSIETSLELINNNIDSLQTPIENITSGVETIKISKNEQQTARTSIRDDIINITSGVNEIVNQVSNYQSTAERIETAFENYLTDREMITPIWTGSHYLSSGQLTLVYGEDIDFDWEEFQEIVFVVEYEGGLQDTLNLFSIPIEGGWNSIDGAFKGECFGILQDSYRKDTLDIFFEDAGQVPAYKAITIKRSSSWANMIVKSIIGIGVK